ncbi:MAG TPA: uracil-DNA glycosylase [Nitrospirota bacterium]|nr:uracil-DNA glycosylase [Nitrospirota bacterium]
MDDVQQDFLKIVSRVRTHLEYQRALGVRTIGGSGVSGDADVIQQAQQADAAGTKQGGSPGQVPAPSCKDLAAVRAELGDCTRCKLHRGRTNIVFGEGSEQARLVFVGEGPGQEEDAAGRPFVGAAGQLLTDIIVKGMKLRREDVYICNIVKCRPPDNRNPEPDEIGACEPFLKQQLAAVNPAVIVALGNIAAKTLLRTGEGITALRGKWRSFEGIPLMPTFHPAYLLRNPKDKKLVWDDIQQVMKKLGLN